MQIIARIKKLIRILPDPAYLKGLIRYGVAAGLEHEKVLRGLRCALVIDVGANRGQFALAARRALPEARIVSFEPLAEACETFRRVFAGDPNVSLHEVAIGPREAEARMHVSEADDSSSLLPIAALQNRLFPGTGEKEERAVHVRRLDDMLKPEEIAQPALLKIDVQGFEAAVLQGCQGVLACFSHVYVECSFMELYAGQAMAHEVIALLDEAGFMLSGIYNLYYSRQGQAVQGDFLFQHKPGR